jgi:Zn-finger nucleic acid-binding protein
MSDFDDDDGPACPACGTEMIPDGVDTADGMEECHRCPRCRLVIVLPGDAPGNSQRRE